MYDKELVLEILFQLETALARLAKRFEPIQSVSDYTDSDEGLEKLDAACMMLQAIGELIKKLDRITGKELLGKYPSVDWKKAMGLRDIIAHQYFDINAEAIFNICDTKIEPMRETINKIIQDIK